MAVFFAFKFLKILFKKNMKMSYNIKYVGHLDLAKVKEFISAFLVCFFEEKKRGEENG